MPNHTENLGLKSSIFEVFSFKHNPLKFEKEPKVHVGTVQRKKILTNCLKKSNLEHVSGTLLDSMLTHEGVVIVLVPVVVLKHFHSFSST